MSNRDDDIYTITGQVVALQIMVICECGSLAHHVVDCTDDEGFWTAPMQDRFHLCESCESIVDAGLKITVNDP